MSTPIHFTPEVSRRAWAQVFQNHLDNHGLTAQDFINHNGLDPAHYTACAQGDDFVDAQELIALSRLTSLTLVQLATEWETQALELALPAPAWAADSEVWEGEGEHWTRVLTKNFCDMSRPDGKHLAIVNVEQWQDLNGLRTPVMDVYVSQPDNLWPFMPDRARQFAQALTEAADLLDRLLAESCFNESV